jgi:hypothetical protein
MITWYWPVGVILVHTVAWPALLRWLRAIAATT